VADTALKAARAKLGWLELARVVRPRGRPTRRIITRERPDGDAVLAAWLVERYLFAGESVEILFLPRAWVFGALRGGDCLVDAGNAHDPGRLLFDHKPPALSDRHDSCAAKLVWEHLLRSGFSVEDLEALVQSVHAGDSPRHRTGYT
jgi:hypothetical protein